MAERSATSRRAPDMILVTGATGHIGGAAARRLLTAGHAVSAMARDAQKANRALPGAMPVRIADYDDKSSLEEAFKGVTRLLFVASDGDGRDLLRQHANVIEAAAASGVERVTFISIADVEETSLFYYAPVYRDAERRLAECGVEWTILRCGLYSEFVVKYWLQAAQSKGEISLPLGPARIALVSRDDVAEAAAAVVASSSHWGKTYELTGPRSYSFDEIVAAAAEAFALPFRYSSCSPTDYLRRAWTELCDPWPHAFSTMCASIAQGRYEKVSTHIEQLVGRPAESFEEFLRRTVPQATTVNGSGDAKT